MRTNKPLDKKLNLIWISTIDPEKTLDLSTWVETSRELGHLGWNVTLLGRGRDVVHQVNGVSVTCFSTPKIYLIGHLFYLVKVVLYVLNSWRSADVVLFHQDMALAVLPLRLLRAMVPGPRFVMDTRDFADVVNNRLKTKVRLKFFSLIYRFNRLFADGQTAITERMATYAKVPQETLLGTWPSGVVINKFSSAREMRCWNGRPDTVELVYIGSIVSKRNHIELARAVTAANDKGMNFRFTLYGSGEAQHKIATFAKTAPEAVQLCDPVPHNEVPHILAQAHVGVTSLPPVDDQKYMASSPIKLFEYMAAGMPILATSNPCHVDVVGNGRYGFWADAPTPEALEAALTDIWAHRAQLAELGEEAFAAVEKWTWHHAAVKLSNALQKSLVG